MMTVEIVREVLGVTAFAWLSYRTVRSWPADWVDPGHVWHYRFLLAISSGLALAVSLAAWHYEHTAQPPAPAVSVFSTAMSALVLLFCWRWPRPRSFREDTP